MLVSTHTYKIPIYLQTHTHARAHTHTHAGDGAQGDQRDATAAGARVALPGQVPVPETLNASWGGEGGGGGGRGGDGRGQGFVGRSSACEAGSKWGASICALPWEWGVLYLYLTF